jgi:hypothetical protein
MKRIINGFEVDWASERVFAERASTLGHTGKISALVSLRLLFLASVQLRGQTTGPLRAFQNQDAPPLRCHLALPRTSALCRH